MRSLVPGLHIVWYKWRRDGQKRDMLWAKMLQIPKCPIARVILGKCITTSSARVDNQCTRFGTSDFDNAHKLYQLT